MQVDDIRVFIPSKDYEVSRLFYQALCLKMVIVFSFYSDFITKS